MEKKKLQESFNWICRIFFSRLDLSQWKIKIVNNLPSHGRCNTETRTIELSKNASLQGIPCSEENSLFAILIHELCHAYNGCNNHGKKWQRKMLDKAKIAEIKGHSEISNLIKKEVEKYRKSGIETSNDIYNILHDWVLDAPDVSYNDMINALAREYGLYADEFEKAYKRCRKVYNQTKKEIEDYKRVREAFKKKGR